MRDCRSLSARRIRQSSVAGTAGGSAYWFHRTRTGAFSVCKDPSTHSLELIIITYPIIKRGRGGEPEEGGGAQPAAAVAGCCSVAAQRGTAGSAT